MSRHSLATLALRVENPIAVFLRTMKALKIMGKISLDLTISLMNMAQMLELRLRHLLVDLDVNFQSLLEVIHLTFQK